MISSMHVSPEDIALHKNHKIALYLTPISERIIIGSESAIQARMEGNTSEKVFLDLTRPLGTLFLATYNKHDWDTVLTELDAAHRIMLQLRLPTNPFYKSPHPHEDTAKAILEKISSTEDPLCKYIVNKIIYGYWPLRDRSKADQYDTFRNQILNLINPFSYKWYQLDATSRLKVDSDFLHQTANWGNDDTETTTHTFSIGTTSDEYVLTDSSLVPLIRYYSVKLENWKTYIIACKVCGTSFCANNLHHTLCSDSCRNISKHCKNVERSTNSCTHNVDRICNNANSMWYRRLQKIRKSKNWTDDEVREFEIEMEHFQAEKVQKRKDLKYNRITYHDFDNWLHTQVNRAEALINKHDTKNQ